MSKKLKTYVVTVQFVEYDQVTVKAKDVEEALDLAEKEYNDPEAEAIEAEEIDD